MFRPTGVTHRWLPARLLCSSGHRWRYLSTKSRLVGLFSVACRPGPPQGCAVPQFCRVQRARWRARVINARQNRFPRAPLARRLAASLIRSGSACRRKTILQHLQGGLPCPVPTPSSPSAIRTPTPSSTAPPPPRICLTSSPFTDIARARTSPIRAPCPIPIASRASSMSRSKPSARC
jgi:hypothetical protein